MPKEIKTRIVVKNIKALDKAVSGTAHAKEAFIRSKHIAESTQDPHYHSASEYAADHTDNGMNGVTRGATNRLRNPRSMIRQNVNKAKSHFREAKRQLPKQRKQAAEQVKKAVDSEKKTADAIKNKAEQAQKTAEQAKKAVSDAKRTVQQTRQARRQTVLAAKQSARTGKQVEITVKTSAKSIKSTGKGTIKTAKQMVKTAERTAKTAVKTAKRTAKTAQQTAKATAKAAKAAKLAAQASRAAAKAAVVATKAVVKGTISMIKAAIAVIKGLVSIIAAGGWVAVLIVVIICLIGLLVSSVFGIFFSGEDSGSGHCMPAVVSELTTEFYNKIEDIKNQHTHDILDIDTMSIHWPEVLAVYAVKVNTDPDKPADVATLDDDKVNKLRDVLNDMISLSHSLKTEARERTVTDDDGNETTESVSITTLTIALAQKSAEDMTSQYGFSQTQIDQLHELLSPEYDDLWAALLGGYTAGDGETGTPDGSRVPKDIFSWPVSEGFRVTSLFGYRKDPFTGATKYHGGVDIGAPEGTPILAMADGIVSTANATDANGGGYGYHVKLQHEKGCVTVYAHCSRVAVKTGQEVKKGQVIAYVGSTGRSTGNHLHFEVRTNGERLNPLRYFE